MALTNATANKALDFIEDHPGILKKVSSITDKDELTKYLDDLIKTKEISVREKRFLSDLWNVSNKHPSLWTDIKATLASPLHAWQVTKFTGNYDLKSYALTTLGMMAKNFLLSRYNQKKAIEYNKDILSMEEVSMFIEDFRNLYNSTLDVIYEQNNEEMPLEKVATYNEAAYMLNEILSYK